MSQRFPSLAVVDPQALHVQTLLQSLHRSGVRSVASLPPATACLRFQLISGALRMTCRVEANAWAAVHLPELGGFDWSAMAPQVLAGLTALARPLEFVDAVLDYATARPLPPDNPGPAPGPLPHVLAAEGDVWIESLTGPLPAARQPLPLPVGLKVPIRLQLGEVSITPRRLRRLRSTDIVLIPAPVLRAWRGTCPLFDFTLDTDAFTVTIVHSPFDPDLDVPDPGLHADDPLLDMKGLNDLPLELHVQLCRLTLPLGELAGLREGSVVPLPEQASQQVALVHNGHRIATGTLVQVGDQLGVQLAQVPRLT